MTPVLIVEDHSLLAESLAIALAAEGFHASVAPLGSREQLIALVHRQEPAVVLLDLDLGGALGSGVNVVGALAQLSRVVILSGTPSRLDFAAALDAGAFGFLSKRQPLHELVAAVGRAVAGAAIVPPGERDQLLAELRTTRAARRRELEPFAALTPREASVLRGLLDGQRAEDLARASSVSQATIRSQLRGVLTKLGVTSQLEAVAMARRAGWPFDSLR
jgi:DNA-binding NarL/FixJ family response regulator